MITIHLQIKLKSTKELAAVAVVELFTLQWFSITFHVKNVTREFICFAACYC